MSHCEKQRKTSSWSSRGQYSSLRAPVVGSHRLWCWLTVFLREQYSSSLPEIRTHPGKNRDPQVSHTDTFAPPLSATHTYTQSWTQRRVFFFTVVWNLICSHKSQVQKDPCRCPTTGWSHVWNMTQQLQAKVSKLNSVTFLQPPIHTLNLQLD